MTRCLQLLASLKITPVAMLVLVLGVIISQRSGESTSVLLIVGLGALLVNLTCAILVTPRFRHDAPLLTFHVCLVAVVLLAAYGYLGQFRGRVEIALGQQLDAVNITAITQGMLHPRAAIERLSFEQQGIRVEYAEGLFRTRTRSRVRLPDGELREFGDNVPLEIDGYRFYTSSNKGYSALVGWSAIDGEAAVGVVNFPSYPLNDWNQVRAWTAPDGTAMTLALELDTRPPLDEPWAMASRAARDVPLIVSIDGQDIRLQRGQAVRMSGAVLTYHGASMWMGYSVYFFPLLNWMLSFSLVGALALGWFYLCRFGVLRHRPRDEHRAAARKHREFDTLAR